MINSVKCVAPDSAQKNIVIVLHDLRGGGAERMMVRLANALAETGLPVCVVLLTEGGVCKSELSAEVELVELKAGRTLGAVGRLHRFLRMSQPAIIMSVLTHVNVAAALAAWTSGLWHKLVVSERNTFSLDKKVNRSTIMRLTYWLAPRLYRRLTHPVIAVSRGVAQDLITTEGLRSKDVVVAPNPVLTQAVLDSMNKPATHPWLQYQSGKSSASTFSGTSVHSDKEGDCRVVMAVGRLSHQKGFDTLIRSISLARRHPAILQQNINIKLVVFGEGELRRELQSLIDELSLTTVVDLAGYCKYPLAEIKASSLFVLSSRFEGSPNVLVEAMACGVPVISTNCPSGPWEILNEGKLAPLVPVDDREVLADEIVKCLLTPGVNPELEKQSRMYRASASAKAYAAVFSGTVQVTG